MDTPAPLPGAPGHADAGPGAAGGMRVVVLKPADAPEPASLLSGLARRGARPIVVTDEAAVMIALARGPAAAVIVLQPGRFPRIDDLLAATRRHYPATACWQWQLLDGHPALAPFDAQPDPTPAVEPTPLRLVDAPAVTEQELSMLLGTDPDDEAAPAQGAGG